jgi:hypothetical protein
MSGSSLTPQRMLASLTILRVVVVDTILVSAIIWRVSLFNLRTTGSDARVLGTSLATAR